MKSIFLGLLALFVPLLASSQAPDRGWLAIETDPMTTAFGAKTLSVLVEPAATPHWSFFGNAVRADFPSWMDDFLNPKNKGKELETSIAFGGGLSADYFLSETRNGWYVGVLNLLFNNEVAHSSGSYRVATYNIIPRFGYRMPLYKHWLYLNPFAGLRYEYLLQDAPATDAAAFEAAGLQPFATVHLGIHF